MNYTVIDLGEWEQYTPDVLPDWALGLSRPVGFARRISDGQDWYEFVKMDGSFTEGSVICTVLRDPTNGVETVKAVQRDETMIFPAGSRLIEVLGVPVNEEKPWNLLAWLNYDPATKTLYGKPEIPMPEKVVSASQAKIQLSRMKRGDTNLYAMTANLVAQSNDLELQLWWDEAKTWRPSNKNVQAIGGVFNLSQDDIKAAFDAASKIEE